MTIYNASFIHFMYNYIYFILGKTHMLGTDAKKI